MIVWHYTIGRHLPAIIKCGVLLPSAGGRKEVPAVWFSASPTWEPAAVCGFRAPPGYQERLRQWRAGGQVGRPPTMPFVSAEELGGMYRVGVAPETAPLTWGDFLRAAEAGRVASAADRAYEAAALSALRQRGSNPDDWRLTLAPVSSRQWLAVEEWDGRRWNAAPMRAR